MKIAMIGTGYVGLVSGVCLSDFGHEVVCVDNNPDKLALLRANWQYFTTSPRAKIRSSRPIFIVGMPRSGTTLTEQILSSHRVKS